MLLYALRFPRGRYSATRASHLSGVPERTVYDWASQGVLVPDYHDGRPKLWSYRDLVYLRLLARLRGEGIPRRRASAAVHQVRQRIAEGDNAATAIRVVDKVVLIGQDAHDALTGQGVLANVVDLARPFDLLEPIEGVNRHPSWGPDLIEPTTMTYISPHVLAGEPCINDTRIPTSALLALVENRHLDPGRVVALYPQITEEQVEDAVFLERRMRQLAAAA